MGERKKEAGRGEKNGSTKDGERLREGGAEGEYGRRERERKKRRSKNA